MKIVITPRGFAKFGQEKYKELVSMGFDVEYNDTGNAYTKEQFLEKCKDADGVIIGVESCDKEFMDYCTNLKAIVKFGVGTDNIDLEYAKEKNIKVGRTVGSNSRSVCELVMSFMFADSKNLYSSLNEVKDNKWNKQTGYELLGKTVGIIGFGAIGKKVAAMAIGIGMRVMAYDAFAIDKEYARINNIEISSVDDILKNADFVTLHCPLNDDTRNMIDEDQLKLMKNNAVLINTARGGIVNEESLYDALKQKRIRAAYFDVLTEEPPSIDNKLLQLENFYLTPHIASRSQEAEINTTNMASDVIVDLLKN